MAALLTSVLENTDKVIEYINECSRIGIKVLPPDVNISGEGFTVAGDSIRFGLLAVKNIGRGMIRELITERQNGKFTDFTDFCERMYGKDMNKRALESLIKSGALDCVCGNRRQMLEGYEPLIDDIDTSNKNNIAGQITLFDDPALSSQNTYALPEVEEYDPTRLLAMEKETTGLYISGHPMARFQEMVSRYQCTLIADVTAAEERGSGIHDGNSIYVAAIVNGKRLKSTRNGEMMAFVQLEDTSGSVELLVFPKVLNSYSSHLREGAVVVLRAKVSMREEEEAKLVADVVWSPAEFELAMKEGTLNARQPVASPKVPAPSKNAAVYLRMQCGRGPVYDKVKNLLSIFAPDKEDGIKVVFYFEESGTYNIASKGLWVHYHAVLERELKKLLGENNVVYKP